MVRIRPGEPIRQGDRESAPDPPATLFPSNNKLMDQMKQAASRHSRTSERAARRKAKLRAKRRRQRARAVR
jgi:hypothetical protein